MKIKNVLYIFKSHKYFDQYQDIQFGKEIDFLFHISQGGKYIKPLNLVGEQLRVKCYHYLFFFLKLSFFISQ